MRPHLYATLLAASYAAVGGTYIVVSSVLVAHSADTVIEMSDAELVKGLTYVFITAAFFLVFAFLLFRRIAVAEREVARAREAFLAAERRATLGLFAAAIGHDFSNILMIFQLGLAELHDEGESAEIVESMRAATLKAEGLVRRLSDFSRSAQEEIVVADARREVEEAVELLRRHHTAKGVSVAFEAPEPIEIAFYPVLLHQIVMNLVMNSIRACPPQGKVLVRLAKIDDGSMELTVEDDGPGLPDVTDDELFAPFYTTRFDGTGLGLPSVKYCVDAHGGSIETGTSALGGALFRIRIPDNA